eukprot:528337-Rhodomonas_salina.1
MGALSAEIAPPSSKSYTPPTPWCETFTPFRTKRAQYRQYNARLRAYASVQSEAMGLRVSTKRGYGPTRRGVVAPGSVGYRSGTRDLRRLAGGLRGSPGSSIAAVSVLLVAA